MIGNEGVRRVGWCLESGRGGQAGDIFFDIFFR
jgi:hypothetical protein